MADLLSIRQQSLPPFSTGFPARSFYGILNRKFSAQPSWVSGKDKERKISSNVKNLMEKG